MSFLNSKNILGMVKDRTLRRLLLSLQMTIPTAQSVQGLSYVAAIVPGGFTIAANNWQSIYSTSAIDVFGYLYDEWADVKANGNGFGVIGCPDGADIFVVGVPVTTTAGNATATMISSISRTRAAVASQFFQAGYVTTGTTNLDGGGLPTMGIMRVENNDDITPAIYVTTSGKVFADCYYCAIMLRRF